MPPLLALQLEAKIVPGRGSKFKRNLQAGSTEAPEDEDTEEVMDRLKSLGYI
jgi:hypothetical protein